MYVYYTYTKVYYHYQEFTIIHTLAIIIYIGIARLDEVVRHDLNPLTA